jgi:6,7-dimethyl-8-ribityllumazine synthase
MREVEGAPDGAGVRVGIVAARFNGVITSKLVEAARDGLLHHGVADDDISLVWVPGAFEIPLAAMRVARRGEVDAVICLGAVIRGETGHFGLVANEAARGVAQVSLDTGVPCVFEVLATENLSQAEARAGGEHGNKGWEAARVALAMVSLLGILDRAP